MAQLVKASAAQEVGGSIPGEVTRIFFRVFLQRKKNPGHRLFRSGFFPGIFPSEKLQVFLAPQASAWANANVRESVGKVDHASQSDASAGSTGLTGEDLTPEIRDLLRRGYTGKWTRCPLRGRECRLNPIKNSHVRISTIFSRDFHVRAHVRIA